MRSGTFVINYPGKISEYKSFKPVNLPPEPNVAINNRMINLISEATFLLQSITADVKYYSNVNTDVLIAKYMEKESLMSSQIEGTQATLKDLFNPEIDTTSNQDVHDVLNYIKALHKGKDLLNSGMPLFKRIVCEMHAVLMQNVRGNEKEPGQFRSTQNWIGKAGSDLNSAIYVPPNVADMEAAIDHLDNFMNKNNDMNVFIKCALVHYQFETIHPFLDGNGRIGRLLIVLYLLANDIKSAEYLYISYYLKSKQGKYYELLMNVRNNGDYESWCEFFLEAIVETAKHVKETLSKLHNLNKENEEKISNTKLSTKISTIKLVLEYLESKPIIQIGPTAKDLGKSYNTIAKAISELERLEIIQLQETKLRNKVYVYTKYLNILTPGTE